MSTPALRFRGFTGKWENDKLGNIFKISAGGDINPIHVSEDKTQEFKYPIFANAEKQKGLYGYANVFKIEAPALTVAGRGVNIGIAHSRNENFYPIVRLLVLKGRDILSYKFFEYQINKINLIKESTGVPQLTAPQISNYFVKKPSFNEQVKIAQFFTKIDEKLEALKKKKELLEQYKKGVMQKIFSQELRFKDEEGKDFPEWEVKKLGEVGITYGGLSGKTADDFGEGKPYIQYKQIFDNSKIDLERCGYVSIRPNERQNKVKFGDILLTVSSETPREIGYSSAILDDVEELYLNSFCFGFRPNSLEELFPGFLRYLFRSIHFRKNIYKLAQGSTRYNMSKSEFLKLPIPVPQLIEQEKIAEFLTSIDDKIALVEQQINKTELWKKGLLQQMFV